ncbi:MAG TPA: VWA domain-containing protein [Pyrinomonadaceae bacterium]|nr:VWA domain-containing protein [Pyrinomonadaceae bacterium]
MKRISACLGLFSLIALFAVVLNAQTRPRRVSQNSEIPATNSGRPTQAPVLGGATRSSGEQSSSQDVATDGPEEVDANDVVRVNTTLVTLPVSVMDRDGRYIPNLRKEDFRLWEDGVEQTVAVFSSVDKPFSVVLMLDTSGSTRYRLGEIQDAAITFVNQLRRDDQVMVVSFDDQIRVLSEFTSDRSRLRDAIRRSEPGESTKLYDAVDLVMNQRLNRVTGRKAIVLFTDGVDTTSRHASYESNIRDAEELDALIYPVQYDTYEDQGGGGGRGGGGGPPNSGRWPNSNSDVLGQILGGIFRKGGGRRGGGGGGRGGGGRGGGGGGGNGNSQREYEVANRYLHDLADRTGARSYQGDSAQDLNSAFANIAEELRRQYTLGYYPKSPAQAGERRSIKVRVNQPNLAVRTRDNYVFNPNGTEDTAARSAPVLQKKLVEMGQTDDWSVQKD